MDCSKYLDELVHPVIDDMIERLIKTKPDDPIPIILEVLEKHNGRESVPLTTKEELELKDLQKRWKELKSKPIETKEEVKITVSPSKPSEKEELKFSKSLPRGGLKRAPPTDSDSDTDDTETFSRSALLKVKPQSKKPPRASVSAEVMGLFNSRAKVKHVVVPKDEATRQKIKLRLKDSFTTKNLDDKDIDVVVDAIKEVHFKDGDYIIKQGDDGNEFYILESGECECYKLFPGDEVAKKLRDYVPGESFGELALLYNAPRAATIKAVEDVTLWSLDRQTFNMIVKDASRKNREMYEEFLKSVELLSSMDYYELVSLSDALKKEKYKAGDFIIKEGEIGDWFYFMIQGEAIARKVIDGQSKDLITYESGDYFGERALLTHEPRAASIVATSDEVTVAKLENKSFKRLLGPVEDILMRNMKNYAKFHSES